MNEKEIKNVVEATEKDFQSREKEKLEKHIKELVTEILEKIDKVKEELRELNDKKKSLEMDLSDLRNGSLKLIEERHQKDKKSQKVAIFEIHETHIHNNNPWYVPFEVTYPPTTYPWQNPVIYGTCGAGQVGILTSGSNCKAEAIGTSFTTTGADCKSYVVGTYTLSNGSSTNIR